MQETKTPLPPAAGASKRPWSFGDRREAGQAVMVGMRRKRHKLARAIRGHLYVFSQTEAAFVFLPLNRCASSLQKESSTKGAGEPLSRGLLGTFLRKRQHRHRRLLTSSATWEREVEKSGDSSANLQPILFSFTSNMGSGRAK